MLSSANHSNCKFSIKEYRQITGEPSKPFVSERRLADLVVNLKGLMQDIREKNILDVKAPASNNSTTPEFKLIVKNAKVSVLPNNDKKYLADVVLQNYFVEVTHTINPRLLTYTALDKPLLFKIIDVSLANARGTSLIITLSAKNVSKT